MPTLFLDRRRGELLTSLASGRRKTTLAELWRAHEASSATVNLYVVDSDDNGRLAPVDLSASDDKPLFRMAADKLDLRAGYLTLTFGGDTTTAIELDRITAHQIETRLNQAEAVITAGRVDVEESPGDGTARAFRIRFRAVGSRATMTAAITGDQPPVGPTITTIEEGDADDRETVLLVLAPRKIISLETVAWTALTAPTVAISTLATGSASVSSSFRITVGTASSAIPRTYHFRIVVGGATTGLIKTDASALEVEGAIADALGTTGTWRARKVAAHSWEITKAALGVATMTLTDTLATGWAGLTGTLTADSGAVLSLVAGSRKTECRATIESGAGEMLYRETLPLVSAIEGLGSTSPLVTARTVVSASDPTVNDDSGDGYGLFTLWVNTTDDGAFILADNTAGAAVWTEIGGSGSAASILASLLTVDGAGSGLDADLLDGYSSAAFLRAANNLSDVADADTALYNIGGMTEIERWAVGDGTSTPVSEWLTGGLRDRGYANLAAIQAVYPHVGATTDQIDWAVIQNALDDIGAATTTSRIVTLPTGTFMLNRVLSIQGPGVTLCGQGVAKSILKFTGTTDGIHFDLGTGAARPHDCEIRGLTVLGLGYATSTKIGILAGKSDASEDYEGQNLRLVNVESNGWATALFAANFPALSAKNCKFIGSVTSVKLRKCDTFLFDSCFTGNNVGYNDTLTTATPTRCFDIGSTTIGEPAAAGFGGLIQSGEHGNCAEFLYLANACPVEIKNANTESFTGSWWIKVISGHLQISQVRMQGLTGTTAIVLDPYIETPYVSPSPVTLIVERLNLGDYSGNPIGVRGNDYDTPYIVAPEHPVAWQASDGSENYFVAPRTDNYIPVKGPPHHSRYSDTDGDNTLLRGRTYWIPSRTSVDIRPDHFLTHYKTLAGTHRQSDLINEHLIRTINATFPDVGNVGAGTDTLATVATEASLLWANGMSIEVEAWGVYGATASNKTIVLTWLSEVFNSGAFPHNGIAWRLKSTIYRESSASARYVTTFEVDGIAAQVVRSTAAVTTTSASNMVLAGIGTANNDIVCNGFIVRALK